MDLFLFGFFLYSFVAPFFSESAKILARRLFSEKQKSLPDTPNNVIMVVISVIYYL